MGFVATSCITVRRLRTPLLGALALAAAACTTTMGGPGEATGRPDDTTASHVEVIRSSTPSAATTSGDARDRSEFLSVEGVSIPLPPKPVDSGNPLVPAFDYPATVVGTSGPVTVYYDPSLGTTGLNFARNFLDLVAAPYADMQSIFGISGSPMSVIIVQRSGKNDGTGGAYHHGCGFAEAYVDATFDNTNVSPLSLEVGLYTAELSEMFMGVQNKGWVCNGSNGEGLSRYLAEYEMAPNQLPFGITGPSWAKAGFPDWISSTENTDLDSVSTGASIVYLYWMRYQCHSIAQIVQAGGGTLAANYTALTGNGNAYGALKTALSGLTVSSDDPFPTTPTVTSISPSSGPNVGGSKVTVNIAGACGTPQITFGGTPAVVTCQNLGKCTATSPWYVFDSAAQTVDVQATVAGKTSPTGPQDRFTFTAGPSCTSYTTCDGVGFGFPDLVVECPSSVAFSDDFGSAGVTYEFAGTSDTVRTDNTYSYEVLACFPGSGESCSPFSTYYASSTACGTLPPPPPPPSTCNLRNRPPPSACKGVWRCCGSDGWECGVCS